MPATVPPQPLTERERTAIAIAQAAYSSLPPSQADDAGGHPIALAVAPLAVGTDTAATLLVAQQVHKYMQDRAEERAKDADAPGLPGILREVIRENIEDPVKEVLADLFNSVEELHQAHNGADLMHIDPDLIKQVGLGFATQADSEASLAIVPEIEKMTGTKLHKKWLTVMDGRARPLHAQLHTNSVPVDEPFYDGHGVTIRYPGDPLAPLSQTINCRCHLIFTPADAEEVGDMPMAASGILVAAGRVGRVVDRVFDMMHPRGSDGQFIEKNAIVDVSGLHGFQHGQRGNKTVLGKVVEIIPGPGTDATDSSIKVQITDPRWDKSFGDSVYVHKEQIAQHVKAKGNLPTPAPKPDAPYEDPLTKLTDPVPVTPIPGLKPDPDGPNFAPLVRPDDWVTMPNIERIHWVDDQMSADLTEFRGKPTTWAPDTPNVEFDFALANRYRELANADPKTAQRIDGVVGMNSASLLDPSYGSAGFGFGGTIAVAYAGTEHGGGVGPHIKPAIIALNVSYFHSMDHWNKNGEVAQKASNGQVWSFDGDPTTSLIHEFGHQRQYRFLEMVGAMEKGQQEKSPISGRAWSPLKRFDGFDRVPDSSNWDTTQDLRYQIQHEVPTEYGQSKSSEAYAEAWAGRAKGKTSTELDKKVDDWEARMTIPSLAPTPYIEDDAQIPWEQATPQQIDEFWTRGGPLLMQPEMTERYPDAAKEYAAWLAAKPAAPIAQPAMEMAM